MILLLIEITSVFEAVLLGFPKESFALGFGAPSEAAPKAFRRMVSLGLMPGGVAVGTMFGCDPTIGGALIRATLKGPLELVDVNSQFAPRS
jgi:hypothetical protein